MKTMDRLSQTNPLRGLTSRGLVSQLENGQLGYYTDLQWLFHFVEKRNATARGVRRKLIGALSKLDYGVKILPNLPKEKQQAALDQKQKLEEAYWRICNLRKALIHLALADLRGFAHCEKIYAGPRAADPWAVTELRVVPQWYFVRRSTVSPWEYNSDLQSRNTGEPIIERDWIIREIDDPADEIFAICHVKMQEGEGDWAEFNDTYAVPPIFIEGPPFIPPDKEKDYQAVAEQIVSAGRGYLPDGSTIHTVGTRSGSSTFVERLQFYKGEIALAGTGGTLTMLADATGIGKGPAEEHENTWLDIAAAIAQHASETMQEQFDLPELRRIYGPHVEPLVYFEYSRGRPKDARAQAETAKAFNAAALQIDVEELSERSGWKLKRKQTSPAVAAYA
jgi:phage gp29-like protein